MSGLLIWGVIKQGVEVQIVWGGKTCTLQASAVYSAWHYTFWDGSKKGKDTNPTCKEGREMTLYNEGQGAKREPTRRDQLRSVLWRGKRPEDREPETLALMNRRLWSALELGQKSNKIDQTFFLFFSLYIFKFFYYYDIFTHGTESKGSSRHCSFGFLCPWSTCVRISRGICPPAASLLGVTPKVLQFDSLHLKWFLCMLWFQSH